MHFTLEAQRIASGYLTADAIAIDATCGNGFDTLFLAEQVGLHGVLYGFDIQELAIKKVSERLLESGHLNQCRLFVESHSNLETMLDPIHFGAVSVIMFNLGYLPLGDKSIVTTPESTLAALDQSLDVLRTGGLISVLAYPGHPGGRIEASQVSEWIEQNANRLQFDRFQDPNNSNSPILWALTKKEMATNTP